VSEWSNTTVCGLFQYTSTTACQTGVTQLFVDCSSILVVEIACQNGVTRLFMDCSSILVVQIACQNGVTRLFIDCSSILVVQRVRI
jgi:hypothetical protein